MADTLSPRVVLVNSPEDAAREMRRIGVCDGGVDAMTGKSRTLVVKIHGATVPAAHIIKQQMLSLGGDAAVHKNVLTHEVDSTDILVMGTPNQLRDLSGKLSWQPFGLPELGEAIAALIETVDSKHTPPLRARNLSLDLSERVRVMGILNVTPDSFSDGGQYMRPTAALERAMAMVGEGADIIDVGGQSSRPGSTPISQDEELERVVPVIERIAGEWPGAISVDTYRAGVAEAALEAGASIVNDITAFTAEPAAAEVTARFGAACVLMHMRGTPETMQEDPEYDDLIGEIAGFLRDAVERAESAGIDSDRIVVDPGLGFGKTTDHNLAILKRLPELRALGKPLMIGPSRKSFIGRVLDLPVEERLEGTVAAAAYGVAQGAKIIRVHDVAPVARAIRLVEACLSSDE